MNRRARKPSLTAAAYCQLELLMRFMYPVAIIVIMLIGTLAFYHSVSDTYYHLPPWRNSPAATSLVGYLAIVGVVAGLFTWVNESPRKRRYHYSLPIGRITHNLLRLGAGALWLMVAIVVFCLVIAVVEDRFMFANWILPSPLFWFAVFAVPLLTYLLTSILAVAFEWAVVWLVGLIAVVVLLEFNPVEKALPEISDVQHSLIAYNEPRSLLYAVMGFPEHAPWFRDSAARLRVFDRTADEFYATNPSREYVGSREEERASLIRFSRPRIKLNRNWFTTLLMWYVIACSGLAVALMRRPVG